MTPFEVRTKVQQYRYNNNLFSPQEAEELRKYSELYSIPFSDAPQRLMPESDEEGSGVLAQFGSGLLEGYLGPLALGGFADDPQDETQSIAHSVGHLLGFAVPLAGSLFTFGATGASMLGARGVGKALQTGGEFLKRQKSIPLRIADEAEELARKGLAKAGYEAGKYLDKAGKLTVRQKLTDSAFQGAHLAVASGVSGLFNGENDEMDNLLFGAVAGGFFGGLGNFVRVGNMVQHPNPKIGDIGKQSLKDYAKNFSESMYNYRGQIIRGALGAGFQGGMATMQGAPTATQIYEYALGGFFGKGAHGIPEKQATKFFNRYTEKAEDGVTLKYKHEDMMNMLKTSEFADLSPDAQKLVQDKFNNHVGELWNQFTGETAVSRAMANEMVDVFNKALERKAEEINKKTKDLEPHEIAEIKADLLDVIPKQYRRKGYMDIVVEDTMTKIRNNEELDGTMKEVVSKMTPKDIEATKKGVADPLENAIINYYEKLPIDRLETRVEDIVKAEEKLASDQAETHTLPLFNRFFDNLVKIIPQEVSSNDVLRKTVEFFNDYSIIKKGSNWKQTEKTNKSGKVKLITKEIEGIEPSTGKKATLQLVFRNGEFSISRVKFEDGLVTENKDIGRFFKENRKLKVDDNPDLVLERFDDMFTPNKNRKFVVDELVDNYKEVLRKDFPVLDIDSQTDGMLRQAFTRMEQGIIRPVFTYNKPRKEGMFARGYNALKKKITASEPPSADEVMYRDLWRDRVRIQEFGEIVFSAGGRAVTTGKPFEKQYNAE